MQPTFIAAIQLAIGLIILLRGTVKTAFVFMLYCGLLAGSAALVLPSMGGSTIPPLQVALLFVIVAAAISPTRCLQLLPDAIRANRWLACFVAYGIASAILAPRLFAGMMQVAPMKPLDSPDLFETALLGPSTQNLTSAFYLFGTLLVALAAYLVTRSQRGGVAALISAGIGIAWTHVILGLVVMAVHGTPIDAVLNLLRNGNYAQLDQAYQGFVRIRGLFPEPSGFADFGFAFMVLNAELWYRSIRPGATGPAAFSLAMILTFSTSSTAYAALFAYGLFFMLRAFLTPRLAPASRIRQFAFALVVIIILVAAMMLVVPELPLKFMDMINGMTIGKSGSDSGRQRLFWALQGWDAFTNSYGLGIGPGSFRSSSLATAILGSTGVIGLVSFLFYLRTVLQPQRLSTYGRTALLEHSIGGAFAVAAVFSLVPSATSSAKPDPGTNFAFLAGAALALRPQQRRRDNSERLPPPSPATDPSRAAIA
ncbi:glycoside hydrolase [Novosphingobium sp.]|uniref:glycoside hydrolase n=1 Tax=Novosphingobium sp. TaxID=1874826 RepID=UPI0025DA2D9E|nr:glycoside hydrolase [Novosphingobium sp.]